MATFAGIEGDVAAVILLKKMSPRKNISRLPDVFQSKFFAVTGQFQDFCIATSFVLSKHSYEIVSIASLCHLGQRKMLQVSVVRFG